MSSFPACWIDLTPKITSPLVMCTLAGMTIFQFSSPNILVYPACGIDLIGTVYIRALSFTPHARSTQYYAAKAVGEIYPHADRPHDHSTIKLKLPFTPHT